MGRYRIEILGDDKKNTVNIEGCRSIEKYTREEITVSLSGVNFTVFGKDLSMPIMAEKNLCIKGLVKGMELSTAQNGGDK